MINSSFNKIFFKTPRQYKFIGSNFYYNDPLTNTAIQIIHNNNIKLEDTELYKFYNNFQPNNYAEVFNIKNSIILKNLSQYSYFYPWIHKSVTDTFRAGLFGPKDITNVEHRVLRLKNLITLIKKYGFKPLNNDIIEGYILLNNNDYRFLITSGHHRCAVLTAFHKLNIFNFDKIIVTIDNNRQKISIANINNIKNWPGVKSKYISEEEATEQFNNFFSY